MGHKTQSFSLLISYSHFPFTWYIDIMDIPKKYQIIWWNHYSISTGNQAFQRHHIRPLPRDSVSCKSCCSVAKSNGLPFSSCLPSRDIGWSKGWAARRPIFFIVLDAWNTLNVDDVDELLRLGISYRNTIDNSGYSAYLSAFRYRFRLFFLQNLVRGSSLSNRTNLQHLLQTERIWKAYLFLKATTVSAIQLSRYIPQKNSVCSTRTKSVPRKGPGRCRLRSSSGQSKGMWRSSAGGSILSNKDLQTQTGFLSSDKVRPKFAQHKR